MVLEVVSRRTTCKKCCVLDDVIAYTQICLCLYLGSMCSIFLEIDCVTLKWTSCEYHLSFLCFFVFVGIRVYDKAPNHWLRYITLLWRLQTTFILSAGILICKQSFFFCLILCLRAWLLFLLFYAVFSVLAFE